MEQPKLAEPAPEVTTGTGEAPLEPMPSDSTDTSWIATLQHHKERTLWALLALFFAHGASDAVLTSFIGKEVDAYKVYRIVMTVTYTVVIMRWYILDARQHSYRFTKPLFLMLVGCNCLTAPFYFYTTRGKRAWRACGRAFLFFMLGTLAVGIGTGVGQLFAVLLRR